MGNTSQRVSSASPISQFRLLQTHEYLPYKLLSHPKTHQVLILKQLFPDPPNDMHDLQALLQRKLVNKCAFVTQVVHWEQIGGETYCGKSTGCIVLFNNVLNDTLRQYQSINKSVNLQQIDKIITAVLRSLKYYNALNHLPETIYSDFILFDGIRAVLMDPWLCSNVLNSNHVGYKSPERQMFQRKQIFNFNRMNSLLFEFGLLVLDLATNKRFGLEKNQLGIGKININSFLQQNIQDFRLRSQLSIILNPTPDKRLLIFDILLPEKLVLKQITTRRTDFNNYTHTRQQTSGTERSLKRTQTSLKKMRHQVSSLNPSPDRSIHYHSRQTSPESQPLQKSPIKQAKMQKINYNLNHFGPTKQVQLPQNGTRNTTESVSDSTFTYAQMLRTPTQSVQHISKKQTPIMGIYSKQTPSKQHTSGWPFPHKIININTSGNVNFNINMNIDQLQKKMNVVANSQQPGSAVKVRPFQLLDKDSHITLRSDRIQQPELSGYETQRKHFSYSVNTSRAQSLNKDISRPSLMNNLQFKQAPSSLTPLISPANMRLYSNHNSVQNPQVRFTSSNPLNINSSYQQPVKKQTPSCNCSNKQNAELQNQLITKVVVNNQSNPSQHLKVLLRNTLKHGLSFGREHWDQSVKASPPTPSFRLKSLKNENRHQQHYSHNKFQINPHKTTHDQASYEYIRYAARNKDGVMVIDPSQKQKTFESVEQQSLDAHDRTINSQFPLFDDNNELSYIRIEEGASQITQNQHGNATSDSDPHIIKNSLNSKPEQSQADTKKQIQAKEAESIIFDSQAKQKMNNEVKKYSAFSKNTIRSIWSADQIMKQGSNFDKLINQNEQKNSNQNPDDLELKQMQMQGIKKCISQNQVVAPKFKPQPKQVISEPSKNFDSTVSKVKPSIYTHPSKLVVSIGACTLSSSDSVVDHSFVPFTKKNAQETEKDETKVKQKANVMKRNNSSEYKIILQNQFESSYLIEDLEPLEELKSSSSSASEPAFTSSKTLINKLKMSERQNSIQNSSTNRNIPSSRIQIQSSLKLVQPKLPLNQPHPSSVPSIAQSIQSPVKKLPSIFHDSSNDSLKYYVIEQYPTSTAPDAPKQRYEGYKCQGKREGHGAYYYASGYVYQGAWKNDKQHGMGVLCRRRQKGQRPSQTGTSIINIIQDRDQYQVIYEGIWCNGELVKAIGHKKSSIKSRSNISDMMSSNSDPTSLANMLPSSTSLNQRNLLPVTMTPSNPRAAVLSHLGLSSHANRNNTAVSINISEKQLDNEQNMRSQGQNSRYTSQTSNNSYQKHENTKFSKNKLKSKRQTELSQRIQQLCTQEAEQVDDPTQQYDIPTNQPISEQNNNNNNHKIIKLANGDIFKGSLSASLSSNSKSQIATGKLYKVDGKQLQGRWLIKDNQIYETIDK